MTLHQPVPFEPNDDSGTVKLQRLQNQPVLELAEAGGESGPNRPERPLNWLDRHVGTVVHLALELLSQKPELPPGVPESLVQPLEQKLKSLGVWGENIGRCMVRVMDAVERTLQDERGRWILSCHHAEAASELCLSMAAGSEVVDLVIDRTFVDSVSGVRWVVDYKSSAPAQGVTAETFAAEEAERYAEQLRGYRDAVSTLGPQPVRCALYFTSLGLFHPLTDL
jgi:ATP-dependent exoDNAse (exonuclease V) beta subunit